MDIDAGEGCAFTSAYGCLFTSVQPFYDSTKQKLEVTVS